ncbi:2-dehydropantoate 2-reductase [Endozoicomonas sp. OPT23]|uniref:ketopantoate reductase family protein n=1 Tax=Endozoicomonas sp. OPT23 TaxID=2072845 RepID=UPI00129B9DAE|nr:2-dehydropantoate 2-reductase [Endozoicomonas sp. OPT23]MRI33508.1 2-dehydropantoate 2-reductase [Endozoicomonas sp. OPT23]
MKPTSDWHILGAGSIGCLWASKLLQKQQQPTIIVRQQKYQNTELKLVELDGSTHCWPVKTATSHTLNQPIERLLLCTKAQDAFEAISSVEDHLTENCQIVLMQNGMGSQQQIAEAFEHYAVFAASTTEGAWLKEPLHVCHAGNGNTWFGPMNRKAKLLPCPAFSSLSESIIPVSDIEEKLWDKLAINCAINGLTALYDCRNGALLETGQYRKRMLLLIEEVVTVRQALAVSSPESLQDIVEKVCIATAANHSSTCMDARHGRKSELAFINGYLINHAKQLNIKLTENLMLMRELKNKGIRW